jgi:hypothetical protein
MTTKAEFNAEEWQRVVNGPALAGLMVVAAQRGGTLRESMSMAKAYREAREKHQGDLVGEIVASPPQLDARAYTSADDLRVRGLEDLRSTVELLEAKAASDEVDEYKQFILTVAQRAAEADKSGGFLGIGGERVSDAERQALDAIAEALGVESPAAGAGTAGAEPAAGTGAAGDEPAPGAAGDQTTTSADTTDDKPAA